MLKLLILFVQIFFVFTENLISFDEFRKALTDNTYPTPSREQYDIIMNMAEGAGSISSKNELAMFLSQVLWESAGLQHKKEIKCASNGCPSSYRTGREQPGKYYYGRGYIQLTWLYNYEQCSQDLYGDNRLVEDPDLVSDTEEGAWGSAFWYWSKHCHNADGVKKGQFGASTMAINGALECKGPYKVKAFKRYTIYNKVLKAFNLNVKPLEEGCYPMDGSFRLCDAVGAHKNSVGMYHWCNDNCNADDPNCPLDMCGCEGGNPMPKPKNITKTEDLYRSEPKVESISVQKVNKIIPKIHTQPKRDPIPVPTTYTQPKRDPIPDTPIYIQPKREPNPGLPHYTEPKRDPNPDLPHYTEPKRDPNPDLPHYTQPKRDPNPDLPHYTQPKRDPNPDLPHYSQPKRDPNPDLPLYTQSQRNPIPDTPTYTQPKRDPITETLVYTEPKRTPIPVTPIPDTRTTEEESPEHSRPDLKSQLESDLFKYIEPKRITASIDSESEPNLFAYVNPVVNTTTQRPVPRTQILRNEFGRLVRKRPVIRKPVKTE